MANLITNKHKKLDHEKSPSGFQKRVSARKLRRAATTEIADAVNMPATRPTKHSDRKRSGSCPICRGRLAKNARGTRYVRACNHCSAQIMPELRCGRCGTNRVWCGRTECRCKGCGNVVS